MAIYDAMGRCHISEPANGLTHRHYPVAIYDIMGRCHISEGATGQNIRHYSLPTAGVYVVRVNDKGYKVVVR